LTPQWRFIGKGDKCPRRTKFEHLPDFKKFKRELIGETFEYPAGIGPLFNQAKALEPVEKLTNAGGGNLELTSQFKLIDDSSWAYIAAQHPLHEEPLNLVCHGHCFCFWKSLKAA